MQDTKSVILTIGLSILGNWISESFPNPIVLIKDFIVNNKMLNEFIVSALIVVFFLCAILGVSRLF